ncbi:hypothetical protein LHY31_003082 [Salmonella enterica]|nr:hypothetical protein [Salmonella enterica]
MENRKPVNELISAVNEFLRNSNPERLIDDGIHKALCNLVDAVSQQQEKIDLMLERLKTSGPVNNAIKEESGTVFRRSYYRNGVHAGNIYFRIEAFEEIKSWAEELRADFESCLNDFISRLHPEHRACFVSTVISRAHSLTPEEKAEWERLQKQK